MFVNLFRDAETLQPYHIQTLALVIPPKLNSVEIGQYLEFACLRILEAVRLDAWVV